MHHTKGPWKELYTRIDDVRGYQIAHMDLHGKTEEEMIANRRLMAAAPELFASLQKMMQYVRLDSQQMADDYMEAERVIAKATGKV